MSSSLQSSDKARRVDAMLQILGLSHRANTVVGDALLRGVSGGEKKRVTIGVEAIKDSAIFLMDEPTTGLDSSAAYDVRIQYTLPRLKRLPQNESFIGAAFSTIAS